MALFLFTGILHFVNPEPFLRIVPPILPWPGALVFISGVAEIAGSIGLLFRRTRRVAAYGLVLLLVAVFPANIYMAVVNIPFPGIAGQPWAQWFRLPLQVVFIVWVWRFTKQND